MVTQEAQVIEMPIFTLELRRLFLRLSLEERRRLMSLQTEQMIEHYESKLETADREEWQGGDLVEL